MSGLTAIYEALKQMRRDGVDRVFLEDATLARLKAADPSPRSTRPAAAPSGGPTLIQMPTDEVRPAAKTEKAPKPKPNTGPELPSPPRLTIPDGDSADQLAWLRERVLECPVCRQHLRNGEQVVFGCGQTDADILFLGDAPDEDEALSGEPFSGASGAMLTKVILAMGLSREAVYMTNVLKWRPGKNQAFGNPAPSAAAIDFCLPYLEAQMNIIQPKVIVALGTAATGACLPAEKKTDPSQLFGEWQDFKGVALMPTFHPSYLINNDTKRTKRIFWEHLLKVMERANIPISPKQQAYFTK